MLEFEKLKDHEYLISFALENAQKYIKRWQISLTTWKTRGLYLSIYNLIILFIILLFTNKVLCIYPIICFLFAIQLLIPSKGIYPEDLETNQIFTQKVLDSTFSLNHAKYHLCKYIEDWCLPAYKKEPKIKANIFKICMILNFLYIPIIIKNIIIKLNK